MAQILLFSLPQHWKKKMKSESDCSYVTCKDLINQQEVLLSHSGMAGESRAFSTPSVTSCFRPTQCFKTQGLSSTRLSRGYSTLAIVIMSAWMCPPRAQALPGPGQKTEFYPSSDHTPCTIQLPVLDAFGNLYIPIFFLAFSSILHHSFIYWKTVFRTVCLLILGVSWIKPHWLPLLHNDFIVFSMKDSSMCCVG